MPLVHLFNYIENGCGHGYQEVTEKADFDDLLECDYEIVNSTCKVSTVESIAKIQISTISKQLLDPDTMEKVDALIPKRVILTKEEAIEKFLKEMPKVTEIIDVEENPSWFRVEGAIERNVVLVRLSCEDLLNFCDDRQCDFSFPDGVFTADERVYTIYRG